MGTLAAYVSSGFGEETKTCVTADVTSVCSSNTSPAVSDAKNLAVSAIKGWLKACCEKRLEGMTVPFRVICVSTTRLIVIPGPGVIR